jgi:hypothetical protein
MSSDQPPPLGATPPGEARRRKAPTIELEATEVAGSPSDSAGDTPPAGTQSTDENNEEPQPSGASPDRDGPGQRRRAWWPGTALWLAIGAGMATGASIALLFLAADLFIGRDGEVSELDARLTRVEASFTGTPSQLAPAGVDEKTLEGIASRVGKLEAAVAASPAASDGASVNRLSAIEGELKALAQSVSMLGRRSDEATGEAREARQRADATAAALSKVAQGAAPAAADTSARDRIEAELKTLTTRLAAVEGGGKAIESELAKRAAADSRDRSGRMAVAAMAVNVALERGEPFSAELAAVKSLGVDPKLVTPLEPFAASGVPTPGALARELSALVPSLLAAAGPPLRAGGFLEKLQSNAEKLVRIRPLDEAAGSDPAAIVARIEVKAAKGDLAGALADLADLPPTGRAPARAWIEKAQARSAAVESSRRLAADSLAGLSK